MIKFSSFAGGFPGGSEVKGSACNMGDPGSIPESGGSPGEGNGNSLQYSCLEHPTDGGAWWVPWGRKEWTQPSDFTFTFHQGFGLFGVYRLQKVGETGSERVSLRPEHKRAM